MYSKLDLFYHLTYSSSRITFCKLCISFQKLTWYLHCTFINLKISQSRVNFLEKVNGQSTGHPFHSLKIQSHFIY